MLCCFAGVASCDPWEECCSRSGLGAFSGKPDVILFILEPTFLTAFTASISSAYWLKLTWIAQLCIYANEPLQQLGHPSEGYIVIYSLFVEWPLHSEAVYV